MSRSEKDNQPFDDEGLARHIEQALAVEKPTLSEPTLRYRIIEAVFNPVLVGLDNLPAQPCLFTSNHALFALDSLVMASILRYETGRFLRSFSDKFMWTPATENLLLQGGGVIGHPEVCSALMEHSEDMIVFPGGTYEATKPSQQKYSLQWKERYGFARLAAQHGYTIMPTAIVGPDEFYGHLIEGEELPGSALGKLLTRLGVITESTRHDLIMPIPVGTLGSLLPKPQRCYIQFGEPVDLSALAGRALTKKRLLKVRDEVAEQIDSMLCELLRLRAQQAGKESLLRRLLTI